VNAYEVSFAKKLKVVYANKTFGRERYAARIAVLFCYITCLGEDCVRTKLEMAKKREVAAKL
jgi:hypothetical protein